MLMARSDLEKPGQSAADNSRHDRELDKSAATQGRQEGIRSHRTRTLRPTRIVRLSGSRFNSLPKRFSHMNCNEHIPEANEALPLGEAERGTFK